MKVLLINPPYPFEESPTPPFGLMSLAAFLLENGIDVRIEDYIITPYSAERIGRVIREYDPDVIGATGVTMNIKTSLRILKDCKEANPEAITVLGGPHVTFDADAVLRGNPHIDFVVRGEGEVTFLDLLKAGAWTSGRNIAGLSFRQGEEIIHNENRPFIKDINILPLPARHLVQLSKYKALGFPLNMVTSRGCPYNCIFCVGRKMVGSKVRYFDVDRVVDEFEMLAGMGFKQINVVDDLLTADQDRCIAICDEIMRRGIRHKWNAFSRVDTISRELLIKLKEAGCEALCFGIESGDQEILDTAKKKTTIEKIRKAVQLCHETGVDPMASYIMGLPGETPETIEASISFARQLCSNFGFHILAPFPGTEVREKSGEYGIKILTDDWDLYDANQAVCDNGTISPEEINAIAEKFNRLFKNYVNGLLEKEKKREMLSGKDKSYMDNLHTFAFSLDLILKECVEQYAGINNGHSDSEIIDDNIIRDFLDFIRDKTSADEARAEALLSRLFDLNCLKIKSDFNKKTIVWC